MAGDCSKETFLTVAVAAEVVAVVVVVEEVVEEEGDVATSNRATTASNSSTIDWEIVGFTVDVGFFNNVCAFFVAFVDNMAVDSRKGKIASHVSSIAWASVCC